MFRKIKNRRFSVFEIFGLRTKMKLMKETIIWDDSVGLFYLNIAHRLNNKISHWDIRHCGFPCPENTQASNSEGRIRNNSNFILSFSRVLRFTVTTFHRIDIATLWAICYISYVKCHTISNGWSHEIHAKNCWEWQLTKVFVIVNRKIYCTIFWFIAVAISIRLYCIFKIDLNTADRLQLWPVLSRIIQ